MTRVRAIGVFLMMGCTAPPPVPTPIVMEEPPVQTVTPETVTPAAPVATEVVVALTELPADAPLPKEFPDRAERRVGVRFTDLLGEHTLVIAEVKTSRADRGSTSTIYGQDSLAVDGKTRVLWKFREGGDACKFRDTHGLLGAPTFSDRDRDGVVEVGVTTAPDCLTHVRGARVVHRGYAGDNRCDLVGWASVGGLTPGVLWKHDATRCMSALVELAEQTLGGRAPGHAAAVTVGLPAELPGETMGPGKPPTVEMRDVKRTRGGVAIELSWPKIRFEPTIDALELEREIEEYLDVDADYGRDTLGSHEGECSVELASSQMLSVDCSKLVQLWTRAEMEEGIGGAPAGPSHRQWNVWLLPGLPRIDPLELIGDAALVEKCKAPMDEGRYTFDEGGLLLQMTPSEGGSPDDSCMEDDMLAWSAMKPRTERARRAIAEIVGEGEAEGKGEGPAEEE